MTSSSAPSCGRNERAGSGEGVGPHRIDPHFLPLDGSDSGRSGRDVKAGSGEGGGPPRITQLSLPVGEQCGDNRFRVFAIVTKKMPRHTKRKGPVALLSVYKYGEEEVDPSEHPLFAIDLSKSPDLGTQVEITCFESQLDFESFGRRDELFQPQSPCLLDEEDYELIPSVASTVSVVEKHGSNKESYYMVITPYYKGSLVPAFPVNPEHAFQVHEFQTGVVQVLPNGFKVDPVKREIFFDKSCSKESEVKVVVDRLLNKSTDEVLNIFNRLESKRTIYAGQARRSVLEPLLVSGYLEHHLEKQEADADTCSIIYVGDSQQLPPFTRVLEGSMIHRYLSCGEMTQL